MPVVKIWRALPQVLRLGLAVVIALALLRLWPHANLSERVGVSRAVYAQGGQLLRLTTAPDGQFRLWVTKERVAPSLVEAVVTYEDRYFYWHPGVNPFALVRSAWESAFGKRRMGGSTLTMQLARRLYGIDSRSLRGKIHQAMAAVWLELCYSKQDVLEAYLNTAPYGSNIEGVGAASLIYFQKSAKDLTVPESLTLAVIPQNPIKRTAAKGHNPELIQARARLWALWSSQNKHAAAFGSEVGLQLDTQGRAQLPFLAPHTVDRVLAQQPHVREIHTSLDVRMQRITERVLTQYVRERSAVGLTNASALLLDASTMQVKAAVGSANFHDANIQGQVNGLQAKRSPGSTLKPFIYALALDQGQLHPKTVLKDLPTSFGPFSPENFDGRFAGPVSAQEALIRSRNVPAVSVAAKLAKPNLYDFLRLSGVSRLQNEQHYGLALVLGGGEVTMEELASLYATLANGGLRKSLSYLPSPLVAPAPLQLLSQEASYITLDMLAQTPRPDTQSPARPAISWKTGTSWGFRDAWTAGVFGRYVLVVWAGNFDGASNPALVGVEAAAPLFMRIVDALRAERALQATPETQLPNQLRRIEVCASTGGLVSEANHTFCPNKTTSWFIAGKSPIQESQLHRKVWIDKQTGKVLCSNEKRDATQMQQVVVEDWGSDMQRLFAQSGMKRRQGQPAAAGCSGTDSAAMVEGAAPTITSPLRGVQYVLSQHKPEPLSLRADAAADAQWLYWFANDGLLGKTKPGVSLAWLPPQAGNYTLRVVDDQARAESRLLTVTFSP